MIWENRSDPELTCLGSLSAEGPNFLLRSPTLADEICLPSSSKLEKHIAIPPCLQPPECLCQSSGGDHPHICLGQSLLRGFLLIAGDAWGHPVLPRMQNNFDCTVPRKAEARVQCFNIHLPAASVIVSTYDNRRFATLARRTCQPPQTLCEGWSSFAEPQRVQETDDDMTVRSSSSFNASMQAMGCPFSAYPVTAKDR